MSDSSAITAAARTTSIGVQRRLPIGAEYLGKGETHFRVWAPAARRVSVVTREGSTDLAEEDRGYFSGLMRALRGDRYRFRLNDDERLYPDPASRFQPEGPHGPSEVVDAAGFA